MNYSFLNHAFFRNKSALLLLWLLLTSTPVFAHEFKLSILLPPAADGAFMDGFRLAVDQSPDVSHPPGEDAGDHLGGVDVELIIVENVGEPEAARQSAVDLIEQQGVAVIVADLSSATLEAIFAPVTERNALLLATSGTNGAEFATTPHFFALNEQADPQAMDAFTEAFRERFGRDPSQAATRGYLAARLIDVAVGATEGDFANAQVFYEALQAASQSLVAPELARPAQVVAQPTVTLLPTAAASQAATTSAAVDDAEPAVAESNPPPVATTSVTVNDSVQIAGEGEKTAVSPPLNMNSIIAISLVLIVLFVGGVLAYLRKR